jgi:hypothetical protein
LANPKKRSNYERFFVALRLFRFQKMSLQKQRESRKTLYAKKLTAAVALMLAGAAART